MTLKAVGFKRRAASLVVCATMAACNTIALYNAHSYEMATANKAEAVSVMQKATEKYSAHEAEVSALKLNVRKSYEYAKGIPKNEIVASMYEKMMDERKAALFGFLAQWKKRGSLDQALVDEKVDQISRDFDQIIELEEGKQKK